MSPPPHRGTARDVAGGAYEARTRDILVRAAPTYQPAKSNPSQSQYSWTYIIEIENHGNETVQLISRHWIITDAHNRVEHVRGDGVIGEQPTLKPKEAFRYQSVCPLTTPSGSMRGTYRMGNIEKGEVFDIEIPEFSLHLPEAIKRAN
jgi:ApaG protein